jgi:class 3 adenylate cyclase/YHS domain-containing protein
MAERPSEHTFLFADLAGFTAMTEAMGDESAVEVAAEFCDELESLAPQFDAEVIKAIGDAVMVRADQAGAAIRFGLDIVNVVGERHFFPAIRVGMHTGPAIERDRDWFGASVNLAARVSAEASASEVLLTEGTQHEAGNLERIELREHGRRELRNVSEPVTLYIAVAEGQQTEAGFPIDPVCRMAVDPAHAAGQLLHEGIEYRFCSLSCAARFAAEPGRYITGQADPS